MSIEFLQAGDALRLRRPVPGESVFRKYMGIFHGIDDVDATIEDMRGR